MGAVFGCFLIEGILSDRYCTLLEQENREYGETCVSKKIGSRCFLGVCKNNLDQGHRTDAEIYGIGNSFGVSEAVLYNREEILDMFCSSDENISDEEILLRCAAETPVALKNANGDFSGAFYKPSENSLLLFRDHLGVRPLYYYIDDHMFGFSTDLRGLIGLPGADLSPNRKSLYLHTMGYNDQTLCETHYEHIHCVRPGSWMEILPAENGKQGFKVTIHEYWHPGNEKIRFESDREYIEKLKELTEDSIRRRLNAVSGIVGCELSGGFDSAVIAILISRLGRKGCFYSWSWSEEDLPATEEDDERKIIRDICEQENISCHFSEKISVEKLPAFSDSLVSMDVPYKNTAYISEGAAWMKRQGANAVFSGHGGDEGVSHRCNFYELWYHKEYVQYLKGIYRSTAGNRFRLVCWLYRLAQRAVTVHPFLKKPFHTDANIGEYLTGSFKKDMQGTERPLLQFAYDPVAFIMHGGIRSRLDNTAVQGASAGVQYIFPYLDYRLVDFALGIPRYLYQNGRGNRWIFRQAFADLMPDSLKKSWRKDSASTRNLQLSEEENRQVRMHYAEECRQMLSLIENDSWNEYFDFELLRKKIENKGTDAGKLANISRMLYPYACMQNLDSRLILKNEK